MMPACGARNQGHAKGGRGCYGSTEDGASSQETLGETGGGGGTRKQETTEELINAKAKAELIRRKAAEELIRRKEKAQEKEKEKERERGPVLLEPGFDDDL